MTVSYKGIQITGTSGEYFCQIGWMKGGPFPHYSDAEEFIDDHTYDFDDENIYGLASMAQSVREGAR